MWIGPLVVIYSTILIQGLPINNGFSIKFNPIALKEEVKPKSFGTLFAKIPQDSTPEAKLRREVIKSYQHNSPELGTGCTNQLAKINRQGNGIENETKFVEESRNFINLPIVEQPFNNYKILVATAPPNLRMSSGDKDNPLVIYVVFSDDYTENERSVNVPNIYFVRERNGKMEFNKKEKPFLIIDSNRTVTGIKSKEIEKFVRFRNKLTKRYSYNVSRLN